MVSATFSFLFMLNWATQDSTPTLNFASFLFVLTSAIALATLQIAHKH
ncbi:MAG TPA: hypothetical protein V6C63_10855 [Allocoleopsis sp.]